MNIMLCVRTFLLTFIAFIVHIVRIMLSEWDSGIGGFTKYEEIGFLGPFLLLVYLLFIFVPSTIILHFNLSKWIQFALIIVISIVSVYFVERSIQGNSDAQEYIHTYLVMTSLSIFCLLHYFIPQKYKRNGSFYEQVK
ncbi:hypothetical protein [Bacillus solitudinis]|uniref:hypothetical protein n=1 Tax=Bacillus solitudinis TaxID=2014074 RepID=UPI000C23BE44|nr:hypothetical protein [Bacillus solitudinis]